MGRRTRETTGSIYTGASNPKTCIERQQRWGCVEIQSNSFTDLGPGASLTVNCQQSFIESNQKTYPHSILPDNTLYTIAYHCFNFNLHYQSFSHTPTLPFPLQTAPSTTPHSTAISSDTPILSSAARISITPIPQRSPISWEPVMNNSQIALWMSLESFCSS